MLRPHRVIGVKKPTNIGEALLFIIWYNEGMRVIPREVKKVITNSNSLRRLRSRLKLTEMQQKVLVGTLLGDGCLIANSGGKNYRLQIEHSRRQKDYVFWKYQIFKDFVITPPQYHIKRKSWKFRTLSSPEFTRMHKLFYRRKRKILPYNLTYLNDPLVLAVWFMDDGGRLFSQDYGVRGYILNIQNFTQKEAMRIREYFENQLKIPASLQLNKGGYRLYIQKTGQGPFRKMICKYLRREFRYKLF